MAFGAAIGLLASAAGKLAASGGASGALGGALRGGVGSGIAGQAGAKGAGGLAAGQTAKAGTGDAQASFDPVAFVKGADISSLAQGAPQLSQAPQMALPTPDPGQQNFLAGAGQPAQQSQFGEGARFFGGG